MTTDAQHAFEDEVFFSLQQQRNRWAGLAMVCVAIAAVALTCLVVAMPFKEIKPYVVMVDRTTGEAEKVVQVRPASFTEQDAVLQAELVSYIVDRETFDVSDNRVRIPDVMRRSAENASETLAQTWNSSSRLYPPSVYDRDTRIRVVVKSISLSPTERADGVNLARVRINKIREDDGIEVVERPFVITIGYTFVPQENATLEAVWSNPLGFTVVSYRIDAETGEPLDGPVSGPVSRPEPAEGTGTDPAAAETDVAPASLDETDADAE